MRLPLQVFVLAIPLLSSSQAAQISGTVVSAQSGEPLASVELTLSAVQPNQENRQERTSRRSGDRGPSGPSTRTAIDGRFVFDAVTPGEYVVGAAKAGYEGGNRVARRVMLADSAPSATLRIDLNRSPAIEGRVVDADGDPLAGARVELRAWTMSDGRRTLRGVRTEQTDDRGEYRLYNLSAGRYLVYLHPNSLGMRQGGVLYETSGAYYPQGPTPAQAAKLDLAWGVELEGIDFVAPPAAATLVSGSVFREDGAPCQECSIAILDSTGAPAAATRVAGGGRFAVHGLLPDEYSFAARAPRGAGLAIEKAYLPERRPVELTLRLAPGQSVSGVVSLEKAEEGEEIQLDGATVRLLPSDPTLAGHPTGARVQAGGAFEIQAVPQGIYRVRVYGLPGNGYVKRVLLGGAELPDGQLSVSGDGPISGLQPIAYSDGGAVHGRAVDPDGQSPPPPDGIIVLLPQLTAASLGIEQVTAYRGSETSFELNGVPPGEYLLFSAPRDFAWDWSDPTLLADLRRRAARIEVRSGETAEANAPYLKTP